MSNYLAVRVRGDVCILNDSDELGGLIDCGTPHEVLGRICEGAGQSFGDCCTTDCIHYAHGTCPCTIIRDVFDNLYHLQP